MEPWRSPEMEDVSEQERELYEKARDATKEAQRQGDEQLQAAVAAAITNASRHQALSPSSSMDLRSLRFWDARLEGVYYQKCMTGSDFNDFLPTTSELVACILQLWMVGLGSYRNDRYKFPNQNLAMYGHSCVASICIVILAVQLGWSNWYQKNRGAILWWFVSLLWIWETIKLYLVTDQNKSYTVTNLMAQCMFVSIIHRVPFRAHLHSRFLGFCCTTIAIFANDNSIQLHLSSILGHFFGLILAYYLDLRTRCEFLQSFPRWQLDDSERLASLSQASVIRKLWGLFCPKCVVAAETSREVGSIERVPSHRALGGFAGGFGGVSGLKCANPPSPGSSSSNSIQGRDAVSDSSAESDFQSGSEGLHDPNKDLFNANPLPHDEWAHDSLSSASSQVGSELNIRRRFQGVYNRLPLFNFAFRTSDIREALHPYFSPSSMVFKWREQNYGLANQSGKFSLTNNCVEETSNDSLGFI